jgi:hypothetical protein
LRSKRVFEDYAGCGRESTIGTNQPTGTCPS